MTQAARIAGFRIVGINIPITLKNPDGNLSDRWGVAKIVRRFEFKLLPSTSGVKPNPNWLPSMQDWKACSHRLAAG
jgi:hypothetical protein